MPANDAVNLIRLPVPDDSVSFFQKLKEESEVYWASTDMNKSLYGFQVQKHSKWLPGLSENEISAFENELDVVFPTGLKNFYRTMNGLDKPGVNVYGSQGHMHAYTPLYFSFPEDIDMVRRKIAWVLESNQLTRKKLDRLQIPKIFPVTGHRFLILDQNLQILSMHGADIIYWTDCLSKLIACNIFDNIENAHDFESDSTLVKPVKFWLENEQ
jgi:hypothetical protein